MGTIKGFYCFLLLLYTPVNLCISSNIWHETKETFKSAYCMIDPATAYSTSRWIDCPTPVNSVCCQEWQECDAHLRASLDNCVEYKVTPPQYLIQNMFNEEEERRTVAQWNTTSEACTSRNGCPPTTTHCETPTPCPEGPNCPDCPTCDCELPPPPTRCEECSECPHCPPCDPPPCPHCDTPPPCPNCPVCPVCEECQPPSPPCPTCPPQQECPPPPLPTTPPLPPPQCERCEECTCPQQECPPQDLPTAVQRQEYTFDLYLATFSVKPSSEFPGGSFMATSLLLSLAVLFGGSLLYTLTSCVLTITKSSNNQNSTITPQSPAAALQNHKLEVLQTEKEAVLRWCKTREQFHTETVREVYAAIQRLREVVSTSSNSLLICTTPTDYPTPSNTAVADNLSSPHSTQRGGRPISTPTPMQANTNGSNAPNTGAPTRTQQQQQPTAEPKDENEEMVDDRSLANNLTDVIDKLAEHTEIIKHKLAVQEKTVYHLCKGLECMNVTNSAPRGSSNVIDITVIHKGVQELKDIVGGNASFKGHTLQNVKHADHAASLLQTACHQVEGQQHQLKSLQQTLEMLCSDDGTTQDKSSSSSNSSSSGSKGKPFKSKGLNKHNRQQQEAPASTTRSKDSTTTLSDLLPLAELAQKEVCQRQQLLQEIQSQRSCVETENKNLKTQLTALNLCVEEDRRELATVRTELHRLQGMQEELISLKKASKQYEDKCASQQSQLEELTKREQNKIEIDQLRKDLKSYKATNTQSEQKMQELQHRNADLNEQVKSITTMQETTTTLTTQNTVLTQNVEQLQQQAKELQQRIEVLSGEKAETDQQLQARDREVSTLSNTLTTLKEEHKALQLHSTHQQTTVADTQQLEAEYQRAQDDLRDLGDELEQLKEQNGDLRRQLTVTSEQLRHQSHQLEDVNVQKDALYQEMTTEQRRVLEREGTFQEEVYRLSQKEESLKDDNTMLQEQLKTVIAEKDQLTQELADAKYIYKMTQLQIEGDESGHNENNGIEVAELRQQLAEMECRENRWKESGQEATELVEALQQQLSETKSEMETQQAEMSLIKQEGTSTSDALQSIIEEKQQLEAVAKSFEAELTQIRHEHESLQSKLAEKVEGCQLILDEKQKLQNDAKSRKEELKETQALVESLKETLEDYNIRESAILRAHQIEVDTLQANTQAELHKLETTLKERDAHIEDTKKECDRINRTLETFQNQRDINDTTKCDALNVEIHELQSAVKDYKTQVHDHQEQEREITQQCETLEETVKQQSNQIESLNSTLAEYKEQVHNQEAQERATNQQCEAMADSLKEKTDQIESLNSVVEDYKANICTLKEQEATMKHKCDKLEDHVHTLEESNKCMNDTLNEYKERESQIEDKYAEMRTQCKQEIEIVKRKGQSVEEKLYAELQQLQVRIGEHKQTEIRLQKEVTQLSSDAKKLKIVTENKTKLEDKVDQLTDENTRLQTTVTHAEHELKAATKTQSTLTTVNAKLQQVTLENERLQSVLSDTEKELTVSKDLVVEYDKLQVALRDQEQEHIKLSSENDELKRFCAENEESKNTLENELKIAQQDYHRITSENENLKTTLTHLENELKAVHEELKHQQQEEDTDEKVSVLTHENEQLSRQLQSEGKTVERLTEENDQLTKQIESLQSERGNQQIPEDGNDSNNSNKVISPVKWREMEKLLERTQYQLHLERSDTHSQIKDITTKCDEEKRSLQEKIHSLTPEKMKFQDKLLDELEDDLKRKDAELNHSDRRLQDVSQELVTAKQRNDLLEEEVNNYRDKYNRIQIELEQEKEAHSALARWEKNAKLEIHNIKQEMNAKKSQQQQRQQQRLANESSTSFENDEHLLEANRELQERLEEAEETMKKYQEQERVGVIEDELTTEREIIHRLRESEKAYEARLKATTEEAQEIQQRLRDDIQKRISHEQVMQHLADYNSRLEGTIASTENNLKSSFSEKTDVQHELDALKDMYHKLAEQKEIEKQQCVDENSRLKEDYNHFKHQVEQKENQQDLTIQTLNLRIAQLQRAASDQQPNDTDEVHPNEGGNNEGIPKISLTLGSLDSESEVSALRAKVQQLERQLDSQPSSLNSSFNSTTFNSSFSKISKAFKDSKKHTKQEEEMMQRMQALHKQHAEEVDSMKRAHLDELQQYQTMQKQKIFHLETEKAECEDKYNMLVSQQQEDPKAKALHIRNVELTEQKQDLQKSEEQDAIRLERLQATVDDLQQKLVESEKKCAKVESVFVEFTKKEKMEQKAINTEFISSLQNILAGKSASPKKTAM